MIKLPKYFVFFGFVWVILFAGFGVDNTQAVGAGGWAPDQQVPGYLDDTFTPFLVADQNKTVHAFVSQWVDNGDGRAHAIVYRKWTLLGGWTRPIDIILAEDGNAEILGVHRDSLDVIHLIFMSGKAGDISVYYSYAPAAVADWAPAWSVPVKVGEGALGLNSAAIVGDDKSNLIIIYSGNIDGMGVYYVSSSDSGKTWTRPLPFFLTYDTELVPFSLRLVSGDDRYARATWNVVTNLGVDEALYFSSFDFEQAAWNIPLELDRRIDLPDYFGPSFPAIVDNGQEIVIVYNGGNPFTGRPVGAGRPIQRASISLNGGLTWNEPLDPFPFHVGRSGEHTVVLDGNGVPHTLFTQRIESTDEKGNYSIVGGIWHSAFQNGVWANPDRFVATIPSHDVRAIVSQGNVLLVVWREDPGSGQSGVWYSYSILDVPELPIVPLSTVPAEFTFESNSTDDSISNLSTPLPDVPLFDDAPPSNLGRNPALPIIIGVVPVVLILAGVLLGYQLFLKRRQ